MFGDHSLSCPMGSEELMGPRVGRRCPLCSRGLGNQLARTGGWQGGTEQPGSVQPRGGATSTQRGSCICNWTCLSKVRPQAEGCQLGHPGSLPRQPTRGGLFGGLLLVSVVAHPELTLLSQSENELCTQSPTISNGDETGTIRNAISRDKGRGTGGG